MPTREEFINNLNKVKDLIKASSSELVLFRDRKIEVINRLEAKYTLITELFQGKINRGSVKDRNARKEGKLTKDLEHATRAFGTQISDSREKSDVMIDIFSIAIKEDKLGVVNAFPPSHRDNDFILNYPEKVGQALSEAKSFTASSYVKKQCKRLCKADDRKATEAVAKIAIAAKDPGLLEYALKNGAIITDQHQLSAAKLLVLSEEARILLHQDQSDSKSLLKEELEVFKKLPVSNKTAHDTRIDRDVVKRLEANVKNNEFCNEQDLEMLTEVLKIAIGRNKIGLVKEILKKDEVKKFIQKPANVKLKKDLEELAERSSPVSKGLLLKSRGNAYEEVFSNAQSYLLQKFQQELGQALVKACAPEPNQGSKVNKADAPQQGSAQKPQSPSR